MFCSKCGAQIPAQALFCQRCGAATAPAAAPGASAQVVIVRAEKSAFLALILSFLLPGLGQIYNGEIGKGIAFILAYGCSFVLMAILIGFLLAPVIWIWSMVDAFKKSEELNRAAGIA